MTNHDCQFDWCRSDRDYEFEHMSDVWSVTATGEAARAKATENLPNVDLSVWFQEDTDVAPTIHLTIADGGANADLYVTEAILLAEYLRRAIEAASAGTKLNPARIIGEDVW